LTEPGFTEGCDALVLAFTFFGLRISLFDFRCLLVIISSNLIRKFRFVLPDCRT
tara:strand:- start:80 stop:241 length:162 start_codon:yes stop_codon:yes gene_type:complete